jgi:uncharacterized protein (DUF2062 family)
MPRRLIRSFTDRWQPAVDRFTQHPTIRRFAPRLADPDLWHLNRRSTARAVAIGLFCGLIPGPLQMLGAAGLAVLFQANFPLAVITTLYTNPFTIVPLYLLAYEIGSLFVQGANGGAPLVVPSGSGPLDYLSAMVEWSIGMGKPLALGLVILASGLAFIGWATVHIAWRIHATGAWRRRAASRRSKS